MAGIDFLNAAGASCLLAPSVPADPVEVMGLEFPNPVGLAAGLDKNGEHIDALAAKGFEMRKYEREGGRIEIYAADATRVWEVKLDAATGAVTQVEIDH